MAALPHCTAAPAVHAAPFADIYRGMAEIGTRGFGALPKYCTLMMGGFFLAGELTLHACGSAQHGPAQYSWDK
jgi:hypothetical protein